MKQQKKQYISETKNIIEELKASLRNIIYSNDYLIESLQKELLQLKNILDTIDKWPAGKFDKYHEFGNLNDTFTDYLIAIYKPSFDCFDKKWDAFINEHKKEQLEWQMVHDFFNTEEKTYELENEIEDLQEENEDLRKKIDTLNDWF